MENEIWKDIHGFGGRYQVSNYGNARSVDRITNGHKRKGVNLKLQRDQSGYLMINITTEKRKNKSIKIHHAVYDAFSESKRPKFGIICHRDDNKLNNYFGNLYLGDVISNTADRYKAGRTILTTEQVLEIKSKLPLMRNKDLAAEYGIRPENISRMRSGSRYGWINK